ncbi:phytosulfokine receptor 2 [Vigna unguiculata]|uniref:Interleukin-1 receptor-associated kinase 4 n=1 Tax=Vigna unguiculata TaxID=3917 RepID=A0A4D6N2Q9_VIGUN|nr:phytosulfokine receptor 2 [Vigna unguiculata]QCE08063.1 interleukin-1 receptor-associated kinase 4 [Vigna unguiculata]
MEHTFQAIVAAIGSFFVVTLLLAGVIILCQQYHNSSKARTRARAIQRSTRPAPARDASFSLAVVDASWSSDPNLIKITWEELAVATENFSPHLIVGDGSFGLVYKARLSTNALVAVKKLSPDAFQGFREFRAEMETLSKLDHPNIVRILGYWASGPERLLVYEFIEKGNLDQWLHEPDLSRSPLSWETRVNIIRGVAHGLSYLHGLEKPVIHRDIKASNILLDSKFQAHIADFGLARRMDKTHSHVSTQFAGTMGYMPPEYIEGSNVANTKVDVYSFGILMIETMASHRPNLPMKLGQSDIGMVQWARKMREQNAEMEMVDVNISREGLSEESVKEYVRIACECTSQLQKERPSMPEVVEWLDSMPLKPLFSS